MKLFVYGDANLFLVHRGNNQMIKVKTSENIIFLPYFFTMVSMML